jgi:TPR repeat protein
MCYLKRWKIKRLIKKIKAMQANRVNNQPGDEALKKEIAYYFELAALYKRLKGKKKFPFAELMYQECHREAATLEDAQANYQLGQMVLEEAKFRDHLEKEGVFNSESNLKKCKQLYEEAHAYLLASMNLGHIAAKRLRGLCFINGWGVEPDKKGGFELIVDSIEQEGSWDKVPQIFASMGLNKPEFFSAIVQHRKSSS